MTFWLTGVSMLLAYLLGSVQTGVIVSTALGRDVRNQDFPGASGMYRQFGWKIGIGVVLLDLLKGALSSWIAQALSPQYAWYTVAFVVLGHCWPVFFGFNGGQGVAPLAGAAGGLNPLVFLGSLICALLLMALHKVFKLERITKLRAVPSASLIALPVMAYLTWRLEHALWPMLLALAVLLLRSVQVVRSKRLI